jgi:hypothetical protein
MVIKLDDMANVQGCFQSFFMLTTVQPRFFASAMSASERVV